MIVISNTSPLIALASVDHLILLHRLFGEVFIPPAVHAEFCGEQSKHSTRLPDFVRVHPISNHGMARSFNLTLHPGESEAIVLALDHGESLIILDDKQARETAARFDIKVIGTLGILLLAKKQGLIEQVQPMIHQMTEKIAFRLAPEVLKAALSTVGETYN